jgi:preprotein translocase subunit SecG
MLTNFIVVLQVLAGLAVVGLVLVQHGKGADMGASFGAGTSGSLFGATGSANFLSRSTAVAATIFFGCTLVLAFMAGQGSSAPTDGSILDRPAEAAPAPATPSDLIPGAASAPASVVVPAPVVAAPSAPEPVAVPVPVPVPASPASEPK